ncbi:MAG: nucleotidyltransferase family protein, partial [Sporomusaceae bacterium]|nr:nucleotidyltransferase family protein [Sporomusaceae bacterium]
IHSLLGTTQKQLDDFDKSGPLYARVLAFNDQGRLLLKHMNQHSNIPIITKTTHFLTSKERGHHHLTPLQDMLSIDTIASDLYALGIPPSSWNIGGWDFRYPALYLP